MTPPRITAQMWGVSPRTGGLRGIYLFFALFVLVGFVPLSLLPAVETICGILFRQKVSVSQRWGTSTRNHTKSCSGHTSLCGHFKSLKTPLLRLPCPLLKSHFKDQDSSPLDTPSEHVFWIRTIQPNRISTRRHRSLLEDTKLTPGPPKTGERRQWEKRVRTLRSRATDCRLADDRPSVVLGSSVLLCLFLLRTRFSSSSSWGNPLVGLAALWAGGESQEKWEIGTRTELERSSWSYPGREWGVCVSVGEQFSRAINTEGTSDDDDGYHGWEKSKFIVPWEGEH